MNNDELKELFEAHTTALKAEVKSQNELLGYKMDEMIKHQKITNGRVNALEGKCEVYEKHVNKSDVIWNRRRPIIAGFFVVMFLSSLLSAWLVENVDVQRTIEKTLDNKGIVIDEKENH